MWKYESQSGTHRLSTVTYSHVCLGLNGYSLLFMPHDFKRPVSDNLIRIHVHEVPAPP